MVSASIKSQMLNVKCSWLSNIYLYFVNQLLFTLLIVDYVHFTEAYFYKWAFFKWK